jgi:chorismate mutase/prephenate dehydratase
MNDAEEKLQAIRAEIDALDGTLLTLLNRRARFAQEVAELKGTHNETQEIYCPEREAKVLQRMIENNTGPLANNDVVFLFREIMSLCRVLQKPMKVAFLGPSGTFTEAAALKHFGHAVGTQPLESIDAVFREVESGACDYGVVPVENSTEGVVNHTLDMFVRSPLAICGEVELRIHHHLLAAIETGEDLSPIRCVYSHQQSFAQCRKWLDRQLPDVEKVTLSSNAEAARRAAQEPGTAAVAGEVAAYRYALRIVARNIEDEPSNTTRFLIIGKQQVRPMGSDKTSLLLATANRPGALFRLLEPLARSEISMTRIESRPARSGMWEYIFFLDIQGHIQDPKIASALEEIRSKATLCKVLGSYPVAVL